MDNKIAWLLGKARKLKNESLFEGISALEELGNQAETQGSEYKTLLDKVNVLIAKKDEVVEVVKDNKPKKLFYAGIKMIGSHYYSSKDNYVKGFLSVDECAKHFNGK